MPFDGATYTKHETFSLDGLIAWLEGQPPETTYDFTKPQICLLARFNVANGRCYASIDGVEEVWMPAVCPAPWTYGAALQRARSLRDGGA